MLLTITGKELRPYVKARIERLEKRINEIKIAIEKHEQEWEQICQDFENLPWYIRLFKTHPRYVNRGWYRLSFFMDSDASHRQLALLEERRMNMQGLLRALKDDDTLQLNDDDIKAYQIDRTNHEEVLS